MVRRHLPLVLGVALVAAPARSVLPSPQGPGAAEAGVVERISLSALRAEPNLALGETVRFIVQLDATVEDWNPYLSRFGPGDHACFAGWSDDRFLWERAAYDDPAMRLFARHGSAAQRILAGGRRFERYELVGVVREVFLDEPWIEVESAQRLPNFVSEGTILHAARAIELLAEGHLDLAKAQLHRARGGFLPPSARAELDRLLEDCGD